MRMKYPAAFLLPLLSILCALSTAQQKPVSVISLSVDMRDSLHGVLVVRETLSVSPGPLTLLFPQWIQGSHAPNGPIGQLAGLTIQADGKSIPWKRSSVDVYAFLVTVPDGVHKLNIDFQALTGPWLLRAGTELTPAMGRLQWHRVVLYPQGSAAADISVTPDILLPLDWKYATALEGDVRDAEHVRFSSIDLETLIDSPVYAGRFLNRIDLTPPGEKRVTANFLGDTEEETRVPPDEVDRERRMVIQALRLFGPPHYNHYDLMVPLSTYLFPRGLEHLQSSEDGWRPQFLTDRNYSLDSRDRLTHEFTHSWNGKYRRPTGLTASNFNSALDNELLWVYEGGTSYWGVVLAARSGMWTPQEVRDLFAVVAADYEMTTGKTWRNLLDTTNDAVLLMNARQFWPDWQRSADYYAVASLMWLEVDVRIRELTNNRRSLDDFARLFLAGNSSHVPNSYTFNDVIYTLDQVAPFNWKSYLLSRLEQRGQGATLLEDLAATGYRLVYTDLPTPYEQAAEHAGDGLDLRYSVGMAVASDGKLLKVEWDGPAFGSGLTPGASIIAINSLPYSSARLRQAVATSKDSRSPIALEVAFGEDRRQIAINYHGGLRYPHLERVPSLPDRLDRIFEPKP